MFYYIANKIVNFETSDTDSMNITVIQIIREIEKEVEKLKLKINLDKKKLNLNNSCPFYEFKNVFAFILKINMINLIKLENIFQLFLLEPKSLYK